MMFWQNDDLATTVAMDEEIMMLAPQFTTVTNCRPFFNGNMVNLCGLLNIVHMVWYIGT